MDARITNGTIIRILKKIPLLFGLQDQEYEQMLSVCHVVQHREGTEIFCEGDAGREMYVLLAGSVEICSRKGGVLKQMEPGDLFGEIAVVTPLRRTATARVCSDATLLHFSRAEIESLMGRAPRVSYLVMRRIAEVLAERLVAANQRLVEQG